MGFFSNWSAALSEDAAATVLKRPVRGRKNVKGRGAPRRKSMADQCNIEALETRQMLTVVVANSVTLPTALATQVSSGSAVVAEVNAVHNDLFSATQNLPLIGSSITTTLKSLTGSYTGSSIQTAFTNALGHSLPGGSSTATVVLYDTTLNSGTSTNPNQADIDLEFKGTLLSATLNPSFNLGLPGVGLSVSGKLQANVTYDMKLYLVATTAGFYIERRWHFPSAPRDFRQRERWVSSS
jgi:hypothetical protein